MEFTKTKEICEGDTIECLGWMGMWNGNQSRIR